jgi:hypothetical protein
MQVKEANSPVKYLVRKRCADGFNSGYEGLNLEVRKIIDRD